MSSESTVSSNFSLRTLQKPRLFRLMGSCLSHVSHQALLQVLLGCHTLHFTCFRNGVGKGLFWSCWPFSGRMTLTIDQASLDRSLSSSKSLSSTYSISTSEFCTRNSCPCMPTMVHFFSFCLFFSTPPRPLQVSTPLFLTKTWHSGSMQIINHFSTSFSTICSLV